MHQPNASAWWLRTIGAKAISNTSATALIMLNAMVVFVFIVTTCNYTYNINVCVYTPTLTINLYKYRIGASTFHTEVGILVVYIDDVAIKLLYIHVRYKFIVII